MSEPRHRLDPAGSSNPLPTGPLSSGELAAELAKYPPPVSVRSIDFNAVSPSRGQVSAPAPYTPVAEPRTPSGDGPGQLADAIHSSR